MLSLSNWILITLTALAIDLTIGEFKIKHPVQYLGDFINFFEGKYYKNSILRGLILVLLLLFIVLSIIISFCFLVSTVINALNLSNYIYSIIIGIVASTGLSSKCLKDHVLGVCNAPLEEARKKLSFLVTRNTNLLSDDMVYKSLLETHSENLSDGFISPLFYLLLFGLPGLAVFKTVSTLDSMIGYKNEKYFKFGKCSALTDDILNYIPARLTAIIILLFTKSTKYLKKTFSEAKWYSSSPNAGYPVTAAAYSSGISVGGTVYYGERKVEKGIVGMNSGQDIKGACVKFIETHSKIEGIIFLLLLLSFITSYLLKL